MSLLQLQHLTAQYYADKLLQLIFACWCIHFIDLMSSFVNVSDCQRYGTSTCTVTCKRN